MTDRPGWTFCDKPECLLCATKSPRRSVPAESHPAGSVAGEDAPPTVRVSFSLPLPPMPGLEGMKVAYEAAMNREADIERIARLFEVPREMLDGPVRRRFRWAGEFFRWERGRFSLSFTWDLHQWYLGCYVTHRGVDLHVPCFSWIVVW